MIRRHPRRRCQVVLRAGALIRRRSAAVEQHRVDAPSPTSAAASSVGMIAARMSGIGAPQWNGGSLPSTLCVNVPISKPRARSASPMRRRACEERAFSPLSVIPAKPRRPAHSICARGSIEPARAVSSGAWGEAMPRWVARRQAEGRLCSNAPTPRRHRVPAAGSPRRPRPESRTTHDVEQDSSSWAEWHTRGRHKDALGHVSTDGHPLHEDDEEDDAREEDDGDSSIEDGPHDPDTDREECAGPDAPFPSFGVDQSEPQPWAPSDDLRARKPHRDRIRRTRCRRERTVIQGIRMVDFVLPAEPRLQLVPSNTN